MVYKDMKMTNSAATKHHHVVSNDELRHAWQLHEAALLARDEEELILASEQVPPFVHHIMRNIRTTVMDYLPTFAVSNWAVLPYSANRQAPVAQFHLRTTMHGHVVNIMGYIVPNTYLDSPAGDPLVPMLRADLFSLALSCTVEQDDPKADPFDTVRATPVSLADTLNPNALAAAIVGLAREQFA
jgi:hypothetical protein